MTRRTAWWVLLSGLLACDEGKSATPLPPRVEAITARKTDDSAAAFCDVALPKASAPTFALPRAEGTPVDARGARWVNVWATWCPPCIEELPRLRRMVAALEQAGSHVSLQLLSVDTTAAAVEAFAEKHPEVRGSLRLTEPSALEPWLKSIGLDRGATLPVHVFVTAEGKVLCARTGSIRDADVPTLKKLLAPGLP